MAMQDARVASEPAGAPLPLVVDLDGTLLAIDTLHTGLVAALFRDPVSLLGLLCWLPRGRATFRQQVSGTAPANAAALPLRRPFVEWLQAQRDAGCRPHLVTTCDQAVVDAAADHLKIFDSAPGSDGTRNLHGAEKAVRLRQRFPNGLA